MSTRRIARVTALLAAGLGLGCGGATLPGARSPGTDLDQYFVGTEVFRMPDGTTREERSVVVHRTLRPDDEEIVDHVLVEGDAREIESRLHVEPDDRLTLRDSSDAVGSGTLEGERWHWTAAHLELRRPDGTSIIEDEVIGETELRSTLLVQPPDAPGPTVLRRVLRRVLREEYEAERRAIEAQMAAPTE